MMPIFRIETGYTD
jgi:hypothetical protein